jgi:hypothetical protein
MIDSKDSTGFVYVMTKESSPMYFKIGKTEKKPQLRAIELDSTDSPTPSVVVYYVFCEDINQLELLTHKELDSLRVRQNREWFICSQKDAIDAIKRVAERHSIEIHYEKILIDMAGDSNISIDEAEDPKLINDVIDTIFLYGRCLKSDLIKYKKFYDDRTADLNKRIPSQVVGEKSLAKAAYESKILELKEKFDDDTSKILMSSKNDIGDEACSKLQKLAKDIREGKLEPVLNNNKNNQNKSKKEQSINAIIDNLLKQIY